MEARTLRCETLEQMPWRGRAIGHGEKGKGDRPVHIKFMTLGPRFLEGARQEALNPGRKEKKDGDGQCEKRPWQGGSPSPVSRLQRAGWHFNGLVFDWLAALKHWRATPARSDELLATSKGTCNAMGLSVSIRWMACNAQSKRRLKAEMLARGASTSLRS